MKFARSDRNLYHATYTPLPNPITISIWRPSIHLLLALLLVWRGEASDIIHARITDTRPFAYRFEEDAFW